MADQKPKLFEALERSAPMCWWHLWYLWHQSVIPDMPDIPSYDDTSCIHLRFQHFSARVTNRSDLPSDAGPQSSPCPHASLIAYQRSDFKGHSIHKPNISWQLAGHSLLGTPPDVKQRNGQVGQLWNWEIGWRTTVATLQTTFVLSRSAGGALESSTEEPWLGKLKRHDWGNWRLFFKGNIIRYCNRLPLKVCLFSWGSIKQGQILLRVPWKLILRRDLVEEDAVLKETLQKWASDDEKYTSQAIRLWLLYKTHSDDWSPWLYRLPHDIAAGAESLPLALAFSGRSSTLRGTPLQLAAEVQLEGLRSEWGQLKQFLDVSLEKFIWAQAVVSTRSSTLPMDGQVYSCLIPVVDFVNHDFYPNALIKGTKQGVELISSEDIPEGLRLFQSLKEGLCSLPPQFNVFQES